MKNYFKGFVLTLIIPFAAAGQDARQTGSYVQPDVSFSIKSGWSLSAGLGTLGYGGSINKSLNTKWALSAGYYLASFNYAANSTIQKEEVHAELGLTTSSIPIFISYYPFKRGFNIKAGVSYTQFNTALDVMPLSNYEYGNLIFMPENIGSIHVDVTTSKWQPYLGLGFGRYYPKNRFNVGLDIGCFYQGSPDVKLKANKALSPTQNESNQSILNNALSQFMFYPYMNLSINIKLH
ncbi:MAG: hypothetical protein ACK5UI_04570 [Bacteroidota bacterium]|jgi:hypothetical protein